MSFRQLQVIEDQLKQIREATDYFLTKLFEILPVDE